MRLRHFFKRVIWRGIVSPRWIDFLQWKATALPLLSLLKNWSALPSVSHKIEVDFAKLAKRLNLSEADLVQRQQRFKWLSRIWLGFFSLTLAYGVYLALAGAWLSLVSVGVLGAMMLCQAFQYHFWAFQIMQRQCGCSLKAWRLFTFKKWYIK